MSKEKIEEMAKDLCDSTMCDLETFSDCRMPQGNCSRCQRVAKDLYNAGYRKQIEGEWTRVEVNGINYGQVYYQHKECKVNETQLFPTSCNFCPNCGAHMRKEDESNKVDD